MSHNTAEAASHEFWLERASSFTRFRALRTARGVRQVCIVVRNPKVEMFIAAIRHGAAHHVKLLAHAMQSSCVRWV